MKEITRVTTVQVTEIFKISDEYSDDAIKILQSEDFKKNFAYLAKEILKADDVSVINAQGFIRDVEE